MVTLRYDLQGTRNLTSESGTFLKACNITPGPPNTETLIYLSEVMCQIIVGYLTTPPVSGCVCDQTVDEGAHRLRSYADHLV